MNIPQATESTEHACGPPHTDYPGTKIPDKCIIENGTHSYRISRFIEKLQISDWSNNNTPPGCNTRVCYCSNNFKFHDIHLTSSLMSFFGIHINLFQEALQNTDAKFTSAPLQLQDWKMWKSWISQTFYPPHMVLVRR